MQHSSLLESPLTQTTIRSDYIMRISLALAFILCVSFLPVVSAEELQSLFNGKNLDGWAGQAGFWSVQDGSIVGETTEDKPAKPNTFLVWQGGDVSDFELTCKVRFRGNNSGVQYRSELTDAEKFALKGYQADLHPKPEFFGMMYGEKTGRGIIAQRFQRAVAGPKGKAKVTATIGDPDQKLVDWEWNTLRIVAVGNQLIHQVNGINTMELTDNHPEAFSSGVLGLQLHQGAPMRVEFKDIQYRPLKGKEAKTLLNAAKEKPAKK